jgi:hypothetical protein
MDRALTKEERRAIGMPGGVYLRRLPDGKLTLVIGILRDGVVDGQTIGLSDGQKRALKRVWGNEQ